VHDFQNYCLIDIKLYLKNSQSMQVHKKEHRLHLQPDLMAVSPQSKIRFSYLTKKLDVQNMAVAPKATEIVPTMRIMGLNFPVEKHAEYYKNQAERRAAVGACLICEKSPLHLDR
jgi:hypothetical protein